MKVESKIKIDYQDLYKKNDNEEDYNAKIYKLHESLQKKNPEILKTNDFVLINIYTELLGLIYEILINNHVAFY